MNVSAFFFFDVGVVVTITYTLATYIHFAYASDLYLILFFYTSRCRHHCRLRENFFYCCHFVPFLFSFLLIFGNINDLDLYFIITCLVPSSVRHKLYTHTHVTTQPSSFYILNSLSTFLWHPSSVIFYFIVKIFYRVR